MKLRQKIALELARLQYRQQNAGHSLYQLFWECTLRCNFACRHCGSDCKSLAHVPDMPFEDFHKVLKDIKKEMDVSRLSVIMTGGEPLCRKDLETCGRAIYDMGIAWGIVTNAWLLDEKRLISLLKAGIHGITISLDGIGETHDWMRGKKESFNRASQAIRRICDFNHAAKAGQGALGFSRLMPSDAIAFDVVSCINKRSLKQLEALKEHLIALGVSHWRVFTIFPVGRAADDPELQLDAQEFKHLMDFIVATRQEGRIHLDYACEGYLGDYEGKVRDHFFTCQAGLSIASILSDGSISACPSIRSDYHQGNIYRGDKFTDIWKNKFQAYRQREWMKKDKCADCEFFRYCQGGAMHLRDGQGKLLFCHLDRLSPYRMR